MENAMPTGAFTCEITRQRIHGGAGTVQEEKDGVTYLVGRDYALAYETLLRFTSGAELLVQATLAGERSPQVVIRDAQGSPGRLSGDVQGHVESSDAQSHLRFRGRYYDSRTVQALAGAEA